MGAPGHKETEQQMMHGWHLDKRVNIAMIAALLVNIGVTIWWLAKEDSKITEHDNRLLKLETSDVSQSALFQKITETLARLDERTARMMDSYQKRP